MKISICCITYNHENYLKDALESFLSQNMPCQYEIIIADDASTDSTPDIIVEYQKKYPNIIKPILRTKNIGVMKNFSDALRRCDGDYIAYCDGDDFWVDENKIKMQYRALENNPSCAYSFHDVSVVTNSKKKLGLLSKKRANEYFETGVISSSKIIGTPIRLVHANALFFRKEAITDLTLLDKLSFSPNGDFALTVILASKGNCYYFTNVLSAYRKHMESISHKRSLMEQKTYNELIRFCDVIDDYFKNQFTKEIEINKLGINVAYYEGLFIKAMQSKDILAATRNALKLLLSYKESQYNLRDILWIIKNSLKTNFGKGSS